MKRSVASGQSATVLRFQRENAKAGDAAARARLRAADVAALASIRQAIQDAKKGRRARLADVCRACSERRVARREEQRKRREAMRALVLAERAEDRASCAASKERAREKVASAVRELERQGAEVREMARIVRGPRSKPSPGRVVTLRAESDDEVKNNIDPRLAPVWAIRAKHTKPTERASRTEVFEEWVQAHGAEVSEMLEAATERELRKLVAQERALGREMKKAARYRGAAVEHRIESHEDDWGAM